MKKKPTENLALKSFMKENFDYAGLKECGFYTKEIKFNDYEAQAKRVCSFFGLNSIYEYGKNEIRCHLTLNEPAQSFVNENGTLVTGSFITTIFPNSLHI